MRRAPVSGGPRYAPHRGRGHVVTSPVAWTGSARTQDNHTVQRQIERIILETGGAMAPGGNDGDIQYNDDGELAGKPIQAFGYWTPITNGDPVSPEIIFDSHGACVVGFVPTP